MKDYSKNWKALKYKTYAELLSIDDSDNSEFIKQASLLLFNKEIKNAFDEQSFVEKIEFIKHKPEEKSDTIIINKALYKCNVMHLNTEQFSKIEDLSFEDFNKKLKYVVAVICEKDIVKRDEIYEQLDEVDMYSIIKFINFFLFSSRTLKNTFLASSNSQKMLINLREINRSKKHLLRSLIKIGDGIKFSTMLQVIHILSYKYYFKQILSIFLRSYSIKWTNKCKTKLKIKNND